MKRLICFILIFIVCVIVGKNYAEKTRNFLLISNTTNSAVNTDNLFRQFQKEVDEFDKGNKIDFIEKNYRIYEKYFGSLLSRNSEDPNELASYKENIEKLDSLAKELKEKYQ